MLDPRIITRKVAKATGLARYFTGKPCRLGGIAERTVTDKRCQCEAHRAQAAESANRRYVANREYRLEKQKRYAAQNPDKVKANSTAHYIANKSEYIERARNWASDNQERRRDVARNWATSNPDTVMANVHKRRARKMLAIPKWFGELDEMVMAEALDLTKRRYAATGVKWEVDHTIPLAGKTVCGLHVGANIQVIPQTANRRKSNKFELSIGI